MRQALMRPQLLELEQEAVGKALTRLAVEEAWIMAVRRDMLFHVLI